MDYQRACGIHPGYNYRGMNRTAPRSYCNTPKLSDDFPAAPGCGDTCPVYPGYDDCCENLAIVTSPVQCWQNLYPACEALSMGTLFRDLNLPLVGCNGSAYRRM
jgi:hypothetical protein